MKSLYLLALLACNVCAQTTITVRLQEWGLCTAAPLGYIRDGVYTYQAAPEHDKACFKFLTWTEQWSALPEAGGTFTKILTRPEVTPTKPDPGPGNATIQIRLFIHGTCNSAATPRQLVKQPDGRYEIAHPPHIGSCWRQHIWNELWTAQPNAGGRFVAALSPPVVLGLDN